MFTSIDQARDVLAQTFPDNWVEAIVASLVPAIALVPTDAPTPHHFGGLPLAGPGIAWPMSEAKTKLSSIAKDAPEVSAHAAQPRPMTFIGQLELDQIDTTQVLPDLPNEGRLLFFYDVFLGFWENSTGIGKVLWDRTDRSNSAPLAYPDSMEPVIELHARLTSDSPKEIEALLKPDAMSATPTLMWEGPSTSTLEYARSNAFPLTDEAALAYEYAYDDLAYNWPGAVYAGLKLGGFPRPVQGDPREEAAAFQLFNKSYLEGRAYRNNKAKIKAVAKHWQLLLEISIGTDLLRDEDAAIYYLIRRDDLQNQNFNNVVVVQQLS